jgi:hypothetical protein
MEDTMYNDRIDGQLADLGKYLLSIYNMGDK